MKLFEGKTPAERNKMLVALVLPLIALVLLLRMFFGGDSRPAPANRNGNTNRAAKAGGANGAAANEADPTLEIASPLPPIINAGHYLPDAARNIFAFYVPPLKAAPTVAPSVEAPATPAPTPPILVGSVSPGNVFARTADFNIEVSGDKFTPDARVYVEGQELPTTFQSPQQLSAKVPAALIAGPGARTVEVKTPGGQLFSNTATFNVMPAPTPQFTFVGVLGSPGYARDKAILKPTQGNDLLTVQRNDTVAGRFKVVNISERAVEFLDTQLNIKHTVPFTDPARTPGAPTSPRMQPPPQRADDDDDEPQQ